MIDSWIMRTFLWSKIGLPDFVEWFVALSCLINFSFYPQFQFPDVHAKDLLHNEFQVDSAAPNRRGFRLAARDTLHHCICLVVASCIMLCLCQGFATSRFSWFQVISTLWVVLESSQCRRSSICYGQFKLLAEQHNFRTYLSATQLIFMELIGDVCFHPNLDTFLTEWIDMAGVPLNFSMWQSPVPMATSASAAMHVSMSPPHHQSWRSSYLIFPNLPMSPFLPNVYK